MTKNDCYQCPHREEVPGSAHSSCSFFQGELKAKLHLLSLIGQLPTITDDKTGQDLIAFNPHGVKSGWCYWPVNFDPVWVTCNLPIENPE